MKQRTHCTQSNGIIVKSKSRSRPASCFKILTSETPICSCFHPLHPFQLQRLHLLCSYTSRRGPSDTKRAIIVKTERKLVLQGIRKQGLAIIPTCERVQKLDRPGHHNCRDYLVGTDMRGPVPRKLPMLPSGANAREILADFPPL